MAISSGAGMVFTWFSNMTAIAGLMTWFGICVTYIRFYSGMKAQGIDRRTLPYYTRVQPFAAWYGTFGTFIVCLVCLECRSPSCSTFNVIPVQWLERLPQGTVEHRDIRHQLSPFRLVPYPIHRSQVLPPLLTC